VTPKLRVFLLTAVPLVALDVATKELAMRALRPFVPHPVLSDWFRLTLVYNRHGAMGLTLGSLSRVVFGTLALAALGVLGVLLRRAAPADRLRAAALGLLVAGAAGNLWDRLRWSQGVVDFIDVGLGRYRFWTFNVADSALTVGVLALAILMWREDAARARRGASGATP
jgi:signal peptidase II